jgi:predicted DNA-binding transcriptional regulator YafY
LDPAYLGKLNFNDIERFAMLAGVKGLFPSLSRDFLKETLGEQSDPAWVVRGHHYEDLSGHQEIFDKLKDAITESRILCLAMLKDGEVKSYQAVQPYRLINTKGIWYLAAVHNEKLKTFGIGKITNVHFLGERFTRDPNVEAALETQEGIWHASQVHKVLLCVAPEAAEYFKRRQLVPHQKVIEENVDGTLLIETQVGHQNQILPIVRYWIPSVRIVSPLVFQEALEDALRRYLEIKKQELSSIVISGNT